MEYMKASQAGFETRQQISRIFTHGFYQWLEFFSKDKERLTKAFEHVFDLDMFFIAVQDGEIAAITACTDGKVSSIHLKQKILCRELGWIKGSIAYVILKKYLVEHKYPFELSLGVGSIEFVATAMEYRGKGAAYGLISHVMEAMPYYEYVLEVADTNIAAVKLYEKLGFSEFQRVKEPNSKRSGLNFYVYMKREYP